VTVLNPLLTLCLATSLACGQRNDPNSNDRSGGKRKGPPRPGEFLKVFDENKDGKVSRVEFDAGKRISVLNPEIRKKIFQRLDKNGDGFISTEELKQTNPKRGIDPLASADQNKDERISREEFAEHPHFARLSEERRSELFRRLDRNADGFLDKKDGRRHGPRGGRKLPRLKIKGLDLDENGSLSWGEFQNAPAILPLPEKEKRQIFNRFDRDRNREISSEEVRGRGERPDKKPEPKR